MSKGYYFKKDSPKGDRAQHRNFNAASPNLFQDYALLMYNTRKGGDLIGKKEKGRFIF